MKSIIITSELSCVLFMLLILVAVMQQHRILKSRRTRAFITFAVVEIIGLCADAFSYMLDDTPGHDLLIASVNAATFIITNFCSIFYAIYVTTLIREKGTISNTPIIVVEILSGLDILWILAGVFTEKLFRVEEGHVIYGPWQDYTSVIPLISVFAFLGIAFRAFIKLGRRQALLLSSYSLIPFLNAVVLLFYQDLDFSYVITSLSCFTIYIFIQMDAITEARITEQVLIDANKAKSDFLAGMSHEIRTPINAILGMDEMILRETKEANIREYADDIHSAGRSLLCIINDILDLSKIESGKMEIAPVRYDISDVLNDLSSMISIRAREKDLVFRVEASEMIPSGLFGDDVRIRQILTNLLTNAVKYTERGSVSLGVKMITIEPGENGEDTALLRFTVMDTGVGIRPEDMSKLFGEFERIGELKNRNIEGTGLGIPITMRLLELMGSKLDVKSTYGKGSVFSFELRQKILDNRPIGDFTRNRRSIVAEKGSAAAVTAPEAEILLVDDNDLNRKVFVNLMKVTKARVTEADGGPAAIALAAERHFDIIFMDHMMPGMDGVEAMKQIKAKTDGPCAGVPIIALTANAIAGVEEKYLEMGFDGYLSKPFTFDSLSQMLREYLPTEKLQ